MELRQLRYFTVVAEELHFGRAAQRLHITQQSLSSQIKQLEDEIGTSLFQRTTRQVTLTESGSALLKEVRIALNHIEYGIEAVRRVQEGEVGRLTVGYNSTTLYNVMPHTLRIFRERFPNVEVTLREITSPLLEQQILNKDVDVGLMLIPSLAFPELCQEVIYREPTVVALPKHHPLAGRETIHLAALLNEAFVMCPREQKPVIFDRTIALCQNCGFTPRVIQEAAPENAVISLVAAGVGVALVVAGLNTIRPDDVAYPLLTDPFIEFDVSIAWNCEFTSPFVAAFVDVAREVGRNYLHDYDAPFTNPTKWLVT